MKESLEAAKRCLYRKMFLKNFELLCPATAVKLGGWGGNTGIHGEVGT